MIRIEGTRFGLVEVEDETLIRFQNGVIGFPEETGFVLLERGEGRLVGYLQSTITPGLAFPVTDGAYFADYPQPSADRLASSAGIGTDELAILVIVAVEPNSKALEANLLAPLVIDTKTRSGAQVVLDPRKYSAQTSLADPISEAKARMEAVRSAREGDDDPEEEDPARLGLTPTSEIPIVAPL
jgi:flagellar assembly factor FliW